MASSPLALPSEDPEEDDERLRELAISLASAWVPLSEASPFSRNAVGLEGFARMLVRSPSLLLERRALRALGEGLREREDEDAELRDGRIIGLSICFVPPRGDEGNRHALPDAIPNPVGADELTGLVPGDPLEEVLLPFEKLRSNLTPPMRLRGELERPIPEGALPPAPPKSGQLESQLEGLAGLTAAREMLPSASRGGEILAPRPMFAASCPRDGLGVLPRERTTEGLTPRGVRFGDEGRCNREPGLELYAYEIEGLVPGLAECEGPDQAFERGE